MTLSELNALPAPAFVAALAEVFEHSAWVAEAAAKGRPYATVTALHDAMMQAVRKAPPAQLDAFIGGHPELGSLVRRSDLTQDSQAEQGGLGLDRLSAEEFDRFSRLNAAYREKFGIPFIVCVRRQTRDSVLREFERRLALDVPGEREAALREIGLITRLRLVALVDGPGMPVTTGRLSTHVLDTTTGRPATGVRITLHEVGQSARSLLKEAVTNHDGRTDEPLLSGAPLRTGTYELTFYMEDYFGKASFIGAVPIRFSIAEPESHYHVPLLVTPWSYTTYRGS